MNLKGPLITLAYVLLLLTCAFFAGFDTFGFAFAIGDGGGQVDVLSGTLLIGTLAGGVGLIIAALSSWTRWRGTHVIALVSIVVVLPAALLYGWQAVRANWLNSQLGMHFGVWSWSSAILPPLLCVAAAGLSVLRLRAGAVAPSPS